MTMVAFRSFDPIFVLNLLYKKKEKIIIVIIIRLIIYRIKHFFFNLKWMRLKNKIVLAYPRTPLYKLMIEDLKDL